jgi:hypothetical protein
MRCYLPSTGTVLVIIVIGATLLHGLVSHVAAGMGVIAVVLAITALVAGIFTGTALAARAIQRRRAAAGGCVTCRFQCQHALTSTGKRPQGGTRRRPLLVGVYTREPERQGWPEVPLTRVYSTPVPPVAVQPEAAEPSAAITASAAGGGNEAADITRAAQHQDRARSNGDLIPT